MTTTSQTPNRSPEGGGVVDGKYAEKQLNSPSAVIAFSHRARFNMAVELASKASRGRILDYGSGDGTFLSRIAARFADCVGADIAPDQVEDCRERFKGIKNVSFFEVSDLAAPEHAGAYDVVTCMEVLEHCPEPAVEKVLDDLVRLVAPGGTVIVSVPIETGPTFIFKYVVRAVAGWRRFGDYSHYERYALGDAMRMVFANEATRFERPIYDGSHSHYKFNWHFIEERVRTRFDVERIMFSPFNVLGGALSSQVWLICRNPRSASPGSRGA